MLKRVFGLFHSYSILTDSSVDSFKMSIKMTLLGILKSYLVYTQ